MFISTNSVALVAELDVIKQQLKKTTSISETTEIEPCLPQSKFLLKILDISYQDSNTFLLTTSAQMAEALSSTPLFKSVTLASMPCIIKTFPSSGMSVIQIDIWDFQRDSKSKTLIDCSFNFEQYTIIV